MNKLSVLNTQGRRKQFLSLKKILIIPKFEWWEVKDKMFQRLSKTCGKNQIVEQRRNNTVHRTLNWTCLFFLNQPPSTLLRLCVAMGLAFFRSGEKKAQAHQAPHTRKLLLPIQPILVWIPFLISRLLSTRHLLSGKWTISSLRRCKFGREKEMDGCMQFGRPKNDPPPHTSFKGRPPQEK